MYLMFKLVLTAQFLMFVKDNYIV